MSTKRVQTTSETENTCVVCFKAFDIYSIGDCDHPVCFECSTRMRVLCCQNECPICRREMPKVIFTKQIETFMQLKSKALNVNLLDKRFGIYFMSPEIEDAYNKLLEHRCFTCQTEPFRTFHQLRDHMRRQHELFYCDLCTENLKIFSFERRCYTRTLLALHRRKGDPDDKSHKGHPLCEFCDQRYMDSDELYRHLRRDHLYCHFCDADGKHHYYSSYEYLREHFQTEHFLCEEGDCKNEQFTSVFRTEIDLKAHKASIHGKQLGKMGAKQARTLELEFRLAPRPRGDQQNQQQPRQPRVPPPQTLGQHLGMTAVIDHWSDDEGAVGFDTQINEETGQQTIVQNKPINALDPELFPTLSGATAPVLSSIAAKPLTRSSGGGAGITIRHRRQGLAKTDENFPALSTEVPSGSTLRFSVNTPSSSGGSSTKAPNVSIHLNHRPTIGLTARVTQLPEPIQKISPPVREMSEAFPALGSTTNNPVQPAQWLTPKQKTKPKVIPPPPDPVLLPPQNLNSTKDFPSLSKTISNGNMPQKTENNNNNNNNNTVTTKVKKTTSVTVPVTNSWSSEESSKSSETKTKAKKKKSKSSTTTESSITVSSVSSKGDSNTNTNSSKTNTTGALETTKAKEKKKKETSPRILDETKDNKVKKESQSKLKLITPQKNGTVERKRSELTIGNLKTPMMNGNLENDFPALGALNQTMSIKKPPGFESWPPVKQPPPGFTAKQIDAQPATPQPPPPPPGFNNFNFSNDLTFTNSSGQKYSILPNKSSQTIFYSPPNFNQRNKKLIENFMIALSDGDLNEFRQLSHLFKQGTYTAKNYYDYCRKCLGNQFDIIFPELLALLPDISKQKELYNIYKKENRKGKNNVQLDSCAVCGQIVINNDLRHHVANHTLENHFPVLGDGSGSSGEISTAWKK